MNQGINKSAAKEGQRGNSIKPTRYPYRYNMVIPFKAVLAIVSACCMTIQFIQTPILTVG